MNEPHTGGCACGAIRFGVRGHTWDHLDAALPKFDRMPPM